MWTNMFMYVILIKYYYYLDKNNILLVLFSPVSAEADEKWDMG